MNKIGTHNSMSYLPPKKWYMCPFRFIAKCLSEDIKQQYMKGSRMFDIRISFTKDGIPEFRHGLMAFKGDVLNTLKIINQFQDKCYVRLILELTKPSYIDSVTFIRYCELFLKDYPRITFLGGYRKHDWYKLFLFNNEPECNIVLKVSSMTGSKIDDWCPWLYAKLMNKKNIKEHEDKDSWLLIDFI